MKIIFKFFLFTCLSGGIANAVIAQEPAMQGAQPNEKGIVFPSLNTMIDSAIKKNAVVRFRNLEINAKESNLKTQRNYWTRNLGAQADVRNGTYDNFSSNNANGQPTSIITSNSKQWNYGFGVYMKLPVLDLLNRKNQINQAGTELEQAKSMAVAQQDELRQLIIKQYQEILLKQKLLNLKSQNLGNARVNMEMVEKEFRNGIIPVSEYVRISDIVSKAESDFEIAKSEFITTKMILEDIVGFSFNSNNSTKKP